MRDPAPNLSAIDAAEAAREKHNQQRQLLDLGVAGVTEQMVENYRLEAARLAAIAYPEHAPPTMTAIGALLPAVGVLANAPASAAPVEKPVVQRQPGQINPKVHAVFASKPIQRTFKQGDWLGALRRAARLRQPGDPMEAIIFSVGDIFRLKADRAGRVVHQTYWMLGVAVGLCKDTVMRVQQYLQRHGLVATANTLVRRQEDNRLVRAANLYVLVVPGEVGPEAGGPAAEASDAAVSPAPVAPLDLMNRTLEFLAPLLGLPRNNWGWNATPILSKYFRQAPDAPSPA